MRIGIIGAGNMSEAMLNAWLREKLVKPADVRLSDVRADRLAELEEVYGVTVAQDNLALPTEVDVLLLAVKPQQLGEVLDELATLSRFDCLVISIAAGKRLDWLHQRLPTARLVRVMPNIGCRVGEGMSVFSRGAGAASEDIRTTGALLSAFGRVLELPEETMDMVTAVSGSGPAFFTRMARAIAVAAESGGLTSEQALLLTAQTMRGAATLLLEGVVNPDDLIAAVSSARGVTVAGLEVMDSRDFDAIVTAVVTASARRSRELAAASG